MFNIKYFFNVFCLMLVLSSCSSMRSIGVKILGGGMPDASKDFLKENNWQYFKDSMAGNLKLMEVMLTMDRGNTDVLAALTQGFAGYGFGVYETLYLNDMYQDKEESENLQLALNFYSKALEHGFNYLLDRGVSHEKLLSLMREEKELENYLNKNLGEKDFAAVFYTAQAWGSIINLQRTNMLLISQLGAVKGLFDFVCMKKPDFENGACDLFYANYELGRPKMLGGNPEKGKEIFKTSMKKYPQNLMVPVMYLQFVVVAESNKKEFEKMVDDLDEKFEAFNKSKNYSNKIPENYNAEMNLFNAIAFERYKIIKKYKKQFF